MGKKISAVLGEFKGALADNVKKITYHKFDWMNQFKKAYYQEYSQKKYKSNLVNQTFGWMALIAIVAILLIVTILSVVAMPGIAMLGVGLAIAAAALVGIGLLGRVRWNAFSEMSKLQNAPEKIQDGDLRQVVKLYKLMEEHQHIKNDHVFHKEACEITGVEMPEMKPKNMPRRLADDFKQGVGEKKEEGEKKVNKRESVYNSGVTSALMGRPSNLHF